MKRIVWNIAYTIGHVPERLNTALSSEDLLRSTYCPSTMRLRTEGLNRLGPPGETLLSVVDFLSEANQTNRH